MSPPGLYVIGTRAARRVLLAFTVAFSTPLLTVPALAEPAPHAARAPVTASAPQAPTLPAPPPRAEADIRDIRGPVEIPSFWRWLTPVLVALAAALGVVGAYQLVRRMRRERPETPEQIALARLERARILVQPEHSRSFAAAIADTVREYIELRFAQRAAHRTTDEFLRELMADQNGPLVQYREQLGAFLEHCDLAKFARHTFTTEDMHALLDSAIRFVQASAAVEVTRSPASERKAATESSPSVPSAVRTG